MNDLVLCEEFPISKGFKLTCVVGFCKTRGTCNDFKACNTATFLKEILLFILQESANILKDTMK
ncbi:hypothetical protein Scep_017544 [Stephania cephalantha]|uniref:Uncharacterized protein n=1 Tax=Stephania cephalantha TaxID=152367 RepID=A0AAP0IPQ9_9MAGN